MSYRSGAIFSSSSSVRTPAMPLPGNSGTALAALIAPSLAMPSAGPTSSAWR
jgi:hypothetical protein